MDAFGTNGPKAEAALNDERNRYRSSRSRGAIRYRVTPTDQRSASWRVLRVLIVTDEQDTSDGLFTRIRRWGHAPRQAHQAEGAANQHPDVVLLDLEMSSMDGCCVPKQLRHNSPLKEFFIIALANWVDDERRRQCREVGIELVLLKPTDPSVLQILLWLESVRLNRQRAAKGANTTNLLVENVDADFPVDREDVWQFPCANAELPAAADYAKPA